MQFFEIYLDKNNIEKLRRNKEPKTKIYVNYFENRDKLIELYEKQIQCPICKKSSKNSKYTGTLKRAKCPICKSTFIPKERELKIKLYYELLNF